MTHHVAIAHDAGARGRSSRPARAARGRRATSAAALLGLAALLAACDGGSGGSGGSDGSGGSAGGSGGSGGSGGGTTTTSAPSLDTCPTQMEPHVASVLVDPAGMPVWTAEASVTGTVAAAGLDAPPSAECGSGQAWVTITPEDGGGDWTACFQAPSLVWGFVAGDPVELSQTVDEHPIAPASVHTTLRSGGSLVVHVEWTMYEDEVALPDGVTVAKGEKVCSSPEDPCLTEGYWVTASAGGESAAVQPGESGTVGGLRVYLDHYWTQNVSSACDGGDSHIRLSVTPAPAP